MIKKDATAKIFEMSLKATSSKVDEFSFLEIRDDMNAIADDFLGDFAAIEYPGWHATGNKL